MIERSVVAAPLAVAVVAKAPRPGQVKTRLCPPLSLENAAELGGAFLRDTVERVRRLEGVQVVIAYTPTEDRELFEGICPGVVLVPQTDGDLGRRLADIFATLCARGVRAVVAVGADTPTLPLAFVLEAFARLDEGADVVLGPAEDGGYYLIGLRKLHRALFEGIPWSTERVFADTLDRAERAGLNLATLPRWRDVDTFADLAHLAKGFEGATEHADHTRSRLIDLGLLRSGASAAP
jgi:rSAM/selenodomain-associated transferase 1